MCGIAGVVGTAIDPGKLKAMGRAMVRDMLENLERKLSAEENQ